MSVFHQDQFAQLSDHNIYVFGPNTSIDEVIRDINAIGKALQFHVAVLPGDTLSSIDQLIDHLAVAYQFPVPANQPHRISLDGASDYLGDLEWLTSSDSSIEQIRGFLLVYTYPATLITHDATGFATFMDMFVSESAHHIKDGRPFFLILGPIDHQSNLFIRTLKASDHIIYPNSY